MPLIIAHRGASAKAPENTLAAFELAFEMGADGIELDVMLSKDGKLVVIHDDTVDRTTNGSGRVSDFSLSTLQGLDAGSVFSTAFRGEQLPSLAEVFERFGGKMLINVELKNYATPFDDLTDRVVNLVQKYKLLNSVLLSSFNPINLRRARRRLPEVRLGLLTLIGKAEILSRGAFGRIFPYDALHPYYSDVSESLVNKIHSLGRQVNVWTVDEPEELIRLYQLGADGIITNDPQAARKVIEGV
ncbi:MAG: glycerophosphodiester phosphodiesterase [Chloroflexota bacterium]